MSRLAFAAVLVSLLGVTGVAYADDGEPPPPPSWRVTLLPSMGAGVAHFSSAGQFQSTIGMSMVSGEIGGSLGRYGVFARIGYLSSGQQGRWTAGTYALGGSYRLFGDGYSSFGLVARGALLYELWRVSNSGCDIALFFPTNCKDLLPPASSGIAPSGPPRVDVSTDAFGLAAGVRLELPVRPIYVAVDAELSALASLESGAPGTVVSFQGGLVFGFRHRRSGNITVDPSYRPRSPRGTSY